MATLLYFLFRMNSAASTPGTHPHIVSSRVMMIDPQPWSYTARGGKMMQAITLSMDIAVRFYGLCFRLSAYWRTALVITIMAEYTADRLLQRYTFFGINAQ